MEQLQKQLEEFRREINSLKQSHTFPYDVQAAIAERFSKKLNEVHSTTATLDFGNVLGEASSDLTIALNLSILGDLVILGIPHASTSGGSFSAWVSADGTVTVRFTNHTGGAINPASGVFKVAVMKT